MRHNDSDWDSEKQLLTTPDDKWVSSLIDLQGFEWLEDANIEAIVQSKKIAIQSSPEIKKMERVFLRKEGDSIGTISSRSKALGLPSIGESTAFEV